MSTLLTQEHVHPDTHYQPQEHEHRPEGPVAVESGQHHGPSHDGSVVLDVGGDIGAVVLHTPVELDGMEIDIIGMTAGTERTHSLVRARLLPGGTCYAAVYPGLPQGSYRIPASAGFPPVDLTVRGGEVVEADWRTHQPQRSLHNEGRSA